MIELHPDGFRDLLTSLRRIPINQLFARSVLERIVDGRVFVDREEHAQLCYVVHPYGMTLLFAGAGYADRQALRAHLDECRRGPHDLWMQVTSEALALTIDELLGCGAAPTDQPPLGPKAQRYTRANFRFDPARYAEQRAQLPPRPGVKLRALTARDFALPGISVAPHRFWRDAGHFFAHGGGWCVEQGGQLASIAFCAFRFDNQLEIGVETRADFRKRGYAYYAASALVEQCLAQGLEPVWACRKENAASYNMALALGFEPTLEIAYYRLPHQP